MVLEVSPAARHRLVTLCSQRFSEFEIPARHSRPAGGYQPAPRWRIGGDLRRHASAGIGFDNVDEALQDPETDLRLFGKPEAFARRRMGVALANGDDTDQARERAKMCAATIKTVADG